MSLKFVGKNEKKSHQKFELYRTTIICKKIQVCAIKCCRNFNNVYK